MSSAASRPEGAAAAPQRLLIVHNPVAGRRRRRRFEQVLTRLGARGFDLVLRETAGPGDATALARAARPEDGALMVAAGGDGTVNEVVNGLAGEEGSAALPLAILPLGTSNVLAAEIGLISHPESVAHTVAEGTARRISLGRLESPESGARLFVMMAGVGVDARAVAGIDPDLKRRFAQGAYIWSGFKEALRSDALGYRVTLSGARHEAASVIVAKGAHYGGPFVVAPEARLDAAGFQVCLFDRGGVLPVLGYAAAIALKQPHLAPGGPCGRACPVRRRPRRPPAGPPRDPARRPHAPRAAGRRLRLGDEAPPRAPACSA